MEINDAGNRQDQFSGVLALRPTPLDFESSIIFFRFLAFKIFVAPPWRDANANGDALLYCKGCSNIIIFISKRKNMECIDRVN